MAARTKFVKPQARSVTRARVVASERISPSFFRVTVAGPELDSIAPMGADHWFRFFFPAPGQAEFRLPGSSGSLWYAQFKLIPASLRPILRNYTIRELRPAGSGIHGDAAEIDIDFAYHGDIGPASAWAGAATEGDEVGLLDEGLIYHPPADDRWQLLVGDESALPAIAGILRSAPRDLRAEVFVEIPDERDRQELDAPAGAAVHWLVREDEQARPGVLALDAVRNASLPSGPSYTYVAGESELATGLRRHLVNDRSVPKSDIAFTGYWRYGQAAY